MNKQRNVVVTILVAGLLLVVGFVIFGGGSDHIDVAEQPTVEPPVLPESQAGRDSPRTDINRLIADLQVMTDNIEVLNQTMSVLKAENKAQAQALELIKNGVQNQVVDRVTSTAKPIDIGPQTKPSDTGSPTSEQSGLLGIVPPVTNLPLITPVQTQSNTPSQSENSNQIIWIEPLDGGFKQNLPRSNSPSGVTSLTNQQTPGLVDEVSSKAKTGLGLESGKTPYYTIPHGSVIAAANSVTALVGKIPVSGQVQDPWLFKIQTGADILMPNYHELAGLEGTIIEGTAIGNLGLQCVTGRVETITFIFNDGRIVTHRAADPQKGMGYISDSSANPCISGELITNAPQVIGQLGLLGVLEAGATAYANQEMQTTRNTDNTTSSIVIGDHLKNQLGTAAAGGLSEIKKWFADRMDQYFDVIYVPAGQRLDIHIAEEIKIDYDPIGRKIYYEQDSDTARHGYMD